MEKRIKHQTKICYSSDLHLKGHEVTMSNSDCWYTCWRTDLKFSKINFLIYLQDTGTKISEISESRQVPHLICI